MAGTTWDAEIRKAWDTGRRAWPSLDLPIAVFADFAARGRPLSELPDDLVGDVFLAAACATDVPNALKSFRNHVFSSLTHAVRIYDDSAPFAEEVYQRVCETMFVGGPDGQPKIARYKGDGPLARFIATAAGWIALRMATSSARFQGEEALVHHFSQIQTLETAFLKHQHRDVFNQALAIAVRQLSGRERLVLRLNLNEHVSTTRIAAMYKVSQPTVSRWIQRAARSIFSTVKELVCQQLDIDTRELESLLLMVRSQIEITISQAGSFSA